MVDAYAKGAEEPMDVYERYLPALEKEYAFWTTEHRNEAGKPPIGTLEIRPASKCTVPIWNGRRTPGEHPCSSSTFVLHAKAVGTSLQVAQ